MEQGSLNVFKPKAKPKIEPQPEVEKKVEVEAKPVPSAKKE